MRYDDFNVPASAVVAVVSAVLVCVLVASVSCGGGTIAEEPPEVATVRPGPFADERVFADNRYKLRYPASWTFSPQEGELIRGDLVSPGGKAGLQIRVQATSGGEPDVFFDQYVNRYVADMEGHWGGLVERETSTHSEVGGRALLAVPLVHRRSSGQAWFLKLFLWFDDGRVVALQGGAQLQARGEIEPELDRIAASLTPRS